MSAFSAPDAAVITHQPDLDESLLSSTSAHTGRPIEDLYDVHSTALRIVQGGFHRVALQFSDEGLPDAVPVYWALKDRISALCEDADSKTSADPVTRPDLYILADTSYGNCCVDEVAAQHVDADIVVHYGHACLSPTARLPVIYVFPKRPVEVESAAQSLFAGAMEAWKDWDGDQRKAFLLSYDIGYSYSAEDIYTRVQKALAAAASTSLTKTMPQLVLAQLDTQRNYEDKLRFRETHSPPQSNALMSSNGCCNASAGVISPASPAAAGCCGGASTCARVRLLQTETDVEAFLGHGDGSGRRYNLPPGVSLSDCIVLYIGGESLALTNLLLRTGPACPVVAFDPYEPQNGCRRLDGKTNRLLMRRYAAVQKARDASVVGLLVGTLGVQSYLPLLAHLREMLTGRRPGQKRVQPSDGDEAVFKTGSAPKRCNGAGRKVYTISVGKLSPAKLGNFQEVDIFVLLACPENSLVDAVDPTYARSRDFYKPIVTPYEMMLALDDNRSWTGEYVLELNRLVGDAGEKAWGQRVSAQGESGDGDDESDSDRPHFSLVTGGYVSRKHFGQSGDAQGDGGSDEEERAKAEDGAVLVRGANGQLTHVLNSANAMHLSTRSWKGLEWRLGMDAPSVLEEGRAGIAKGYSEADGTREG